MARAWNPPVFASFYDFSADSAYRWFWGRGIGDCTKRGRGGRGDALHHGGKEDTEDSTYYAARCDNGTRSGRRDESPRLPVLYDGVQVDAGYRIDFLVENCVIVELKAVEKLLPLHLAQVLTYLKLSGHQVGLLINFNVAHLRDGIKRVMNGYTGV